MSPEPDPINLGGVGDVDMYPGATHDAVRELFQAGSAFGRVWPGLRASIEGAEKQVNTGFDDLSLAFRATYNLTAGLVADAASAVEGNLHRLAEGGNSMVLRYLEHSGRVPPALFERLT